METYSLTVIKRSGVAEPFNRTKVISSVRKACQGRPVTEDTMAQLVLQQDFDVLPVQRLHVVSVVGRWPVRGGLHGAAPRSCATGAGNGSGRGSLPS
ncbi:hypothetical protein DKG34_23400 [Streptomyces sp. NWU49]|nr:hypothetical protein DKG34_23400 [Streptomyces sp. NWU49]